MYCVVILILCIICYVVQSFFNKLYAMSYSGPDSLASPVFSVIYGITVSLFTFLYNRCSCSPSVTTLLLGILNGIVLLLFNLSFIRAGQTGPYGFQIIMFMAGVVIIPLVTARLLWSEQLSIFQYIGIGFMLLSPVLSNMKGLHLRGVQKRYFLWTLLLFLSNGAYGVILDAHQRLMHYIQRNELIILSFFFSSVFSFIYLVIASKGNLKVGFHFGKKAAVCMMLSSIGATAAINLSLIVLRLLPATIVYAVENGWILILSAVLSAVVLHEKMGRENLLGVFSAIAGIVFLSI